MLGVGGDAGFVGDGEVLSAAVFFGFEEGVEGGLVGEPVLFAAEEDAVAGEEAFGGGVVGGEVSEVDAAAVEGEEGFFEGGDEGGDAAEVVAFEGGAVGFDGE